MYYTKKGFQKWDPFFMLKYFIKAILVSNYLECYLLEFRESYTKCIRIEGLIRSCFINSIS